ncbi:uncharacterized protein LOC125058835 [Pieris napi]|uniref:uncharacterized protein LOC125058835 n=1 Tax=Pieris napi TaxID=78633 RepID=UPI001FB888C3|nr:uncharacterized protein LOC125058835 [Pieris napi]
MVDSEALIAAVREQRLLWDKKHKHYRNRLLVQKSWKNVAEAVECTADGVKKKWKNLRDSYSRELKKVKKPRSGSDADQNGQYQGDWPHFESMQFLKTILKPRKTTSNIKNTILDESDIIDDNTMMSILSDQTSYNTQTDKSQFNTDDTNLATIYGLTTDAATAQNAISPQIRYDTSTPGPSHTPSRAFGTIAKQKIQEGAAKSIEEMLITLEREKIDLMKKDLNQDDDDLNWFKSIMPYMKKLPSLNKLLFRTQVQEMLINEISKLNTPSNTESSMMGDFTSGDSIQ